MVTRLAPTPSGFLHLGNLFNFLLTWHWAREHGARILLRIDDADSARVRPEYVHDIFRTLEALKMDWDMGPSGPDELERQWSQRHRLDLYHDCLQELRGSGKLYVCACSRKSQANQQRAVCTCFNDVLSLDDSSLSWKVHCDRNMHVCFLDFQGLELEYPVEDFVVRRRDGIPAYQVTSITDDRYFRVTHIVRGNDLLESTARQVYLDSLLTGPWLTTARFLHHPLLTLPEGHKLSKSAGHQSKPLLKHMSAPQILDAFAQWREQEQVLL